MIKITLQPFGEISGKEIIRYTMCNDNGLRVSVINFGCSIQAILVPDHSGILRDVVLGYDDAHGYAAGSSFFGSLVGRYANRIGNARFTLNSKTYVLEQNDGGNHLHGVFARRICDGRIESDSVVFSFLSSPEEEGFPGALSVEVRYRLTEDNAVMIDYTATTDEDTVINLTNHTYFNLNGQDGSDVFDHTIQINADAFTEIGDDKLPTGRIISVEGTPMDFRRAKKIGADISRDDCRLQIASGYDHNMILNGQAGELRESAVAKGDRSGIIMHVSTTEPGAQFYTGSYIDEDTAPYGKNGIRYPRYGGFCFETQHYPDSVNHPLFPSTILRKGETYRQTTLYRFSVE